MKAFNNLVKVLLVIRLETFQNTEICPLKQNLNFYKKFNQKFYDFEENNL